MKQESKYTKKILILISVVFLTVMLIIPLFTVLFSSLRQGIPTYLKALTDKYTLSAFGITMIAVLFATLINTFFGITASWLLTKFRFRGQQVLSTLIDIPFSISPVIAGLSFIMTFGRMGWMTPVLDWVNETLGTNIQLVYSVPGVVLATVFVTFPFVSRELIPVMNSQGNAEEEAAAMMGAKWTGIFTKVTFPHIKWALFYGVILCAARAMGEFGAVAALSKTRGRTFTLPLEIDYLYMEGSKDSITEAFAVSSILVLLAIAMLVARTIIEHQAKRKGEM